MNANGIGRVALVEGVCGALGSDGAEGVLDFSGDASHPAETDGRESGVYGFFVYGGRDLALLLRGFVDPLGGVGDVAEEPCMMLEGQRQTDGGGEGECRTGYEVQ